MEVVHMMEYQKTDVYDKIMKDVVITKTGTIKTNPFYEDSKNYE